MATQFQNRLVGTLVLVSLGVIFLPDVFDGKKNHYQENFQAIPLQEKIPDKDIASSIKQPEPVRQKLPIVNVDEEQSLKEGYKDSAWIIRLGAFRKIENAKSLVTELRNKGYPAQLMPRQIKNGELARVEIGPDLSKDKLVSMNADIESLTGLKGQLLRFNPLTP